MAITLVDESEVKSATKEIPKKIESLGDKLKLVPKEDIRFCERVDNGMTDNCAMCKALNKEFFDRCNNKWSYDEC